MDSYEAVGSPGANKIHNKDTKKANYYYDLFTTGTSFMDTVNAKMQNTNF